MTETIQTLKEDIAILQEKLRKLEELQRTKSPAEEAFKKVYHRYPDKLDDKYGSAWDIFEKGYNAAQEPEKEQKWDVVRESKKWCEEHPGESVEDYLKPQTPKPMNEVLDRLENKYENDVSENKQKPKTLYDILYRWWMDIFCNPIYRDWDMETSIEDLVDRIEFWNMRIKNDDEVELDEQENDKNFKNSLDLIREWGEKNKPPTLTELLWEWWDCNDIFTSNSDLDADTCIDYLVNIIGKKFIPPSSDRNGYEWEKCLKMMRDKLR
jgi:hypothetical protein